MNIQISQGGQGAGLTFSGTINVTADTADIIEKSLAVAKAGSLSLRTDNDTGELTLGAGHGVTNGSRIDVFWNIGGVPGHRRGMTVGTVAGNVVPVDGGLGDNLPAQASAITAMVPTEREIRFDGDDVLALLAEIPAQGIIVFADGANAELHAIIHPQAMVTQWFRNNGVTNPLAGDTPVKAFLSHGDSAAARTIKVVVGR